MDDISSDTALLALEPHDDNLAILIQSQFNKIICHLRQEWRDGCRAEYSHAQGVRHMLPALDLTTGKITYRIRERKRWPLGSDGDQACLGHPAARRAYPRLGVLREDIISTSCNPLSI